MPDLIPYTAAVDTLVAEGYAEADILAAYGSLIDAGPEVNNDENAITPAELDVLRDQLNSSTP